MLDAPAAEADLADPTAEVDRLLDAADRERHPAARAVVSRRVRKIVVDDAPWVLLFVAQDVYRMSPRLKGWLPNGSGQMLLGGARLKPLGN